MPLVMSISNAQILVSKFHSALKETFGEVASLRYLVVPETRNTERLMRSWQGTSSKGLSLVKLGTFGASKRILMIMDYNILNF